MHSSCGKLQFTALFLILALVVVGEVAGVVLGRAVRGSIRSGPVRVIDRPSSGGSATGGRGWSAAWLLGSPRPRRISRTKAWRAVQGDTGSKYAPGEWMRAVLAGCPRC